MLQVPARDSALGAHCLTRSPLSSGSILITTFRSSAMLTISIGLKACPYDDSSINNGPCCCRNLRGDGYKKGDN
jgi:hypothetical protein